MVKRCPVSHTLLVVKTWPRLHQLFKVNLSTSTILGRSTCFPVPSIGFHMFPPKNLRTSSIYNIKDAVQLSLCFCNFSVLSREKSQTNNLPGPVCEKQTSGSRNSEQLHHRWVHLQAINSLLKHFGPVSERSASARFANSSRSNKLSTWGCAKKRVNSSVTRWESNLRSEISRLSNVREKWWVLVFEHNRLFNRLNTCCLSLCPKWICSPCFYHYSNFKDFVSYCRPPFKTGSTHTFDFKCIKATFLSRRWNSFPTWKKLAEGQQKIVKRKCSQRDIIDINRSCSSKLSTMKPINDIPQPHRFFCQSWDLYPDASGSMNRWPKNDFEIWILPWC